jgi:hypothetical protein
MTETTDSRRILVRNPLGKCPFLKTDEEVWRRILWLVYGRCLYVVRLGDGWRWLRS